MDYEKIVKDAAVWLDGVEPGWFKKINLETLRMNSCEDCIFGQLAGHDKTFGDYLWDLFPKDEESQQEFLLKYPIFWGTSPELQHMLWTNEISARLALDAQSQFIERTNVIINEHPSYEPTGRELVQVSVND